MAPLLRQALGQVPGVSLPPHEAYALCPETLGGACSSPGEQTGLSPDSSLRTGSQAAPARCEFQPRCWLPHPCYLLRAASVLLRPPPTLARQGLDSEPPQRVWGQETACSADIGASAPSKPETLPEVPGPLSSDERPLPLYWDPCFMRAREVGPPHQDQFI